MDPSTEDAKLITLARSARARIDAHEGSAVRDLDGRTYAAAAIDLEAFSIDALTLAVAMAISSGAKGLEAGVVVSNRPEQAIVDLTLVREFGGHGISVLVADTKGTVVSVHES